MFQIEWQSVEPGYCTHRSMRERGGCIVSVSSTGGLRGMPALDMPYGVSKFGLNGEQYGRHPPNQQTDLRCP